ncbi:hypothetical protein PIB30_039961 [Stylosanthes scabra]|uniref:Uncharacterized protein n=1 Tax=Stylosanthes scabra TaxID=79078 RepID=A0ABU6TGM2_9FABA|nr:hypothetical protein [Stylosanthes scabra]
MRRFLMIDFMIKRIPMKPVPKDITGGVWSGSGRRERKERKDRNKPKRPLLEPMRTHHLEPCVHIQAWAARPIADLGTQVYAYEASMHDPSNVSPHKDHVRGTGQSRKPGDSRHSRESNATLERGLNR